MPPPPLSPTCTKTVLAQKLLIYMFIRLLSYCFFFTVSTVDVVLVLQKDEVTYAELQLPGGLYSGLVSAATRQCHYEQTVYAQIDASLSAATPETPLIGPARESTV